MPTNMGGARAPTKPEPAPRRTPGPVARDLHPVGPAGGHGRIAEDAARRSLLLLPTARTEAEPPSMWRAPDTGGARAEDARRTDSGGRRPPEPEPHWAPPLAHGKDAGGAASNAEDGSSLIMIAKQNEHIRFFQKEDVSP